VYFALLNSACIIKKIKIRNFMNSQIEKNEALTFEEDDSPEQPPQDIVAYNELRSCADLFRMHHQGILEIQPVFQREVVWKIPAQTRFIDSLIKQLPIPSMCFSLDYKTQNWQVIDGLQRISTIIKFLSNQPSWTLSDLEDIDPKISGQPVSIFFERGSELSPYLRRIENLTLPITVLRCDYSKKSHTNYLFTIFHRLNTGGMKLNNQEIRNCIYSGSLNNLLHELNNDENWMKINKMKKSAGYRFTKQELILRFFAFFDSYQNYPGKLAKFLNEYMAENRNPSVSFIDKKKDLFNRVSYVIYSKVFEGKIPQKLSITVLESLLVGIAFNLKFIESQTPQYIQDLYKKLQSNEEFSEQRLSEGLAQKTRVTNRINTSKSIFSGS
jgi:Protein of unknown function DUF262